MIDPLLIELAHMFVVENVIDMLARFARTDNAVGAQDA
jgi:hypothetical protein